MTMNIQTAISEVVQGRDLAEEDALLVALSIMDGGADPCQIAALLVALRMKGVSSIP